MATTPPAGTSSDPEHTAHEHHDSEHSNSTDDDDFMQIETSNEPLARQIRAFLEAAEDVDCDTEIVEDILQALVTDEQATFSEPHVCVDSHGEEEANQAVDSADHSKQPNGAIEEFWSREEIKKMMHVLKEQGESAFIAEYVRAKNIPIPRLLEAFGIDLMPELRGRQPKTLQYFLRVALSHQLRRREKLTQYNTIADAVELIRKSQRILILTGAGISVSCGIPDFRSRDGLYATLKNKGEYDLDDPQQMFDIRYFKENPSVFYSFASQIYPSNFVPSPCHRFIKLVEDQGKLLRNYTQNIDTLETLVGVRRVLQCHGSFASASCLECGRKVPGTEIEDDIMNQRIAFCPVCTAAKPPPLPKKAKGKKKSQGKWDSQDEDESDVPPPPTGIMKPDITFFGEKLSDEFDNSLAQDRSQVDLLLIIGTSLKVSPVAEITSHLPHSIPQILINKTPIRHINPDIVLLGNADDIVIHLCQELGWTLPPPPSSANGKVESNSKVNLKRRNSRDCSEDSHLKPPRQVGRSHVWLFEGAEGGGWLQDLQKRLGVSSRTSSRSRPSSALNSRQGTPVSTPRKDNGEKREPKKQRVL